MDVVFNYSSQRAVKARLARHLGGASGRLILILTIVLIVGGLLLVGVGVSLGWLLVGVAALPAMIVEWQQQELTKLPIAKRPRSIDELLSGDVLGYVPKNPSPQMIAAAVSSVRGGLFFGVRFGLTPNFLQQISSDDQGAAAAVWRDALALRERMGQAELTAGMLVYALIKQFSEHEALLAHNHLSLTDVRDGIMWQQHLEQLIRGHTKPRRTGGIARDWSFGYTPLLGRFGQNISQQISRGGLLTVDLESHQDAVEQLVSTFSHKGRQNAVLVGPTGAGKSTIVHAFAERLLDASSDLPGTLKFRQVVMLDSSSLLSAAPGRGELEHLIMNIFGEAYAAKNVIICLDDAQLFFEEGIGSVDLSNVLQPILDAGRLRIILTMDEQRFLKIGQRNASLVNALNRISVAPASKHETIAVMQDQLIVTEFQRNVTFTYQSLHEAYRLSERYVHDLAMPGRALKLLESAASFSENGLVTMNSVQKAIEQTMDVKVGVASGEDEREKLLNLEAHIHERMINQTRAVGVVSDALRRARAGVRNENRPIGTFLFLGPTGVGKTELAKALADVYFGGEERMVRLDMNEYVQNEDVARLIADGASDSSSLTAQVMKQPFSVVLLDEIEKAHPNVLTTLLQMLDEGILRDIKNREVSFRDAIVIATSNAGADRIREYIERGHSMEHYEAQFIDELISSGQFKPEFINRFDEIVTFTPLGKAELLKVADLMIAGVNKTLALQKLKVVVADDAKQLLVEEGYDPRLGARPMRRVVQRVVENNVAKAVLASTVSPGSAITITVDQVRDTLERQV
ncbi:clp protease ATP binding subunit [Candidatus Saccharibacteria bacterium RAAC3_TM7_1]|nr:clp protease ATP binding subunit [Candidatus Saccharibacteria bacterium RAAC3_TM7_1]HCZ28846.1 ATP-dependent Clp protease ATP-binding subunit [Candidatus Saccharibacteria bacterium]